MFSERHARTRSVDLAVWEHIDTRKSQSHREGDRHRFTYLSIMRLVKHSNKRRDKVIGDDLLKQAGM